MARKTDQLAGTAGTEATGGFLAGVLAEEKTLDRRSLWRLAAWAVIAVGAVTAAMLANEYSIAMRRDDASAADLARQAQQIQALAKESQNQARQLNGAVDTLNGDRDRLFARVTVLEQGLDALIKAKAGSNLAAAPTPAAGIATTEPPMSAQATDEPVSPMVVARTAIAAMSHDTTSLPRPAGTPAPATPKTPAGSPSTSQGPHLAAAAATVAATPAAADRPAAVAAMPGSASAAPGAQPGSNVATSSVPLSPANQPTPAKPSPALTDAASKPAEPQGGGAAADSAAPDVVGSVASTEPETVPKTSAKLAVKRTQFGVDVGGASSVGGLRAMWLGLLKTSTAVAKLSPIIVIKETSAGLGLQLRLVAGPLDDAAAAAKICAALIESQRNCEPAVFDGQRLALKDDDGAADSKPAEPKSIRPAASKWTWHRHNSYYSHKPAAPPAEDTSKKPDSSSSNLSNLFSRR
jgi:hypothetical protein